MVLHELLSCLDAATQKKLEEVLEVRSQGGSVRWDRLGLGVPLSFLFRCFFAFFLGYIFLRLRGAPRAADGLPHGPHLPL